jgi:hypothetical protein
MTAYVAGMLIWNFIKTKDLKSEILYTWLFYPHSQTAENEVGVVL